LILDLFCGSTKQLFAQHHTYLIINDIVSNNLHQIDG
jgi:hypothetical protein